MASQKELQQKVFMAMRDNGMSSVLFRNAIGRRLGLNITDSECLSFLSMRERATPTELSRYTGLTTGSTTAMLDRLERAGYIRRTPNPADRRGVLIEITSKWGETAGPLVAGVQEAHRELIARYTDEELEAIASFMEGFVSNVREQTKVIDEGSA